MARRQEKKAAFLFYIDDWLSSQQIEMMDADEERGYLRLLLAAWKNDDCGLPDDDAELALKSKLGPQWSKESKDKTKRMPGLTSGAKLRKCFFVESGRLYNERQLEERRYQDSVRENRSNAGKKGNETRWQSDRKPDRNLIANGSQTDPNKVSGLGLGFSESPERGAGENQNPLHARFADLMAVWDGHKTEIDYGSQVWISLVDSGEITTENIPDIFAGLERWKTSQQWVKGYVPSVAKWLTGRRWKDFPKQQEGGDKWQ